MKEEHITKVLTQIIEGNMSYERFCRLTDKLMSKYPNNPITKLANSMKQKETDYRSLVDEVRTVYSELGGQGGTIKELDYEDDHFIELAQYALEKRQLLMKVPKKRHYMQYLLKKIACF